MFYLRFLLTSLGFFAASAYGVGLALIRRDRSRVAYHTARMIARLTHPALGLEVEVSGVENMRAHRPCIYISNHQNYFDVAILAPLYPPDTAVVAKKELRGVPFFGWVFEASGNIYIDRSDREKAVGRLREAEEAIRERGVSVWIFPEGTRGNRPGELLPFKKGAFNMAIATRVPLVPVVIEPLAGRLDIKGKKVRPGTVRVRVLEPILAEGLTEADLPVLMETAHRKMSEALQELARERGLAPHSVAPQLEGAD